MCKRVLALFTLTVAATAVAVGDPGQVYTATKVYHTIISEPPYLVEKTTTFVWTQGPTMTSVPHQTGRAG